MEDWMLFTAGEAEYWVRIGRMKATGNRPPAPSPVAAFRAALATAHIALAARLSPATRGAAVHGQQAAGGAGT